MELYVKCRNYGGWLEAIREGKPRRGVDGKLYSIYEVRIVNGKHDITIADARAEEIEVYAT